MKGLFFLSGLLLLVLVPTSNGDGYCRNRAATYYAPAYKTYTPYVAPSYAATYTSPSYDYTPVYKDTYIKTVPYPYNPDYYSSSNDYYRDKVLLDAFAGKMQDIIKKDREQAETAAMKEELVNLRRQLQLYGMSGRASEEYQLLKQQEMNLQKQSEQQRPPPPPTQPEQPPPLQKQQTMPKATGALAPVPEGLQAVVTNNCIRCHGDTYQKDGKGIDLRNLAAVPREVRMECKAAVDDRFMPYRGKGLEDKDAALFHIWATGRSGTSTAQK